MNRRLLRWIACLMLIVLVVPSVPAAAEDSSERMIGVVTGGKLHMRDKPSSKGDVVATYSSGTEVNILKNADGWCQVEKDGKTGYMMSKYLDITTTYQHYGWGKTPADGRILNVFEKPDTNSKIILNGLSGAKFELIGKADGWYQVRSGMTFGYVQSDFITETDQEYRLLSYLDSNNPYKLNVSSIAERRNVGSQKGMSMTKGNYSYTISYPVLALGIADATMSSYVHDLIDHTSQDAKKYHENEQCTLTVTYDADQLDENYASIILHGTYKAGNLPPVPLVKAFTVDLHTGDILNLHQHFTDENQILFQLECKLLRIFEDPSADYGSNAETAWLDQAVLTDDGLAFYIDAGALMPMSMGPQFIRLAYIQCAEYVSLDTPVVHDNRRAIDPTRPMLALTFDDGPGDDTLRILDALEQYGGRATFCVVGSRLDQYKNTLKMTIASGQEIATHTWTHKNLTKISLDKARFQIQSVVDKVKEIADYDIKVLRPPYGSNNSRVRNLCKELGLVIAHWTVDTQDWVTRSASKTYRAIVDGAENGTIILCHDIYETTVDAAVNAIPELVQQGYQLVTVSELLSFHKDGAQPGTTYARIDPENIKGLE